MVNCCVLYCKNRTQTKTKDSGGVSYHRFPNDPHYKEKWIVATGRREWFPTKSNAICSEHFVANDYVCKGNTKRYLIGTAVPSRNIYCIEVSNNSTSKIIFSPTPTTSKEIEKRNAVVIMHSTIMSGVQAPETTMHSKVMNKNNVHGTNISGPVVSGVIKKMNVRGSNMPGVQVFASESGKEDTKTPADPLKMAVEDVKPVVACRACLVTSTEQPLRLIDSKLADAYRLMVSTIQQPDIYPNYICTYCRAILLKFMSFREKCLVAQGTLSEIQAIMDVPITLDVLNSYIPQNIYPLRTTNIQTVSYHPPPTKTTKESVDKIGKQSASKTDVINEISEVNKPDSEKAVHMQPSEPISRIRISRPREAINEDCSQNELKMELVSEHLEDDIEYLEDITDDIINDIKSDEELGSETNHYIDGDLKTNPKTEAATTTATKIENTQGMKCMMIQMDSTGLEIGVGNWNNTEKYDTKNQVVLDEPVIYEWPDDVLPETQIIPETADIGTHHIKKVALTKEQQIQQIQDRKNSVNYIRSKYKCNMCYRGFHCKFAFENHSKSHELIEGNVLCDVCSRSVDKKDMTAHMRDCHRYNYICSLCGHVEKNSGLAKKHYDWHRGLKYECKICHQSFSKNTSVYGHMIWKHKDALISCVICSTECIGERGLQFHMNRSHKEAKDALCASCSVQFFSQDALQRHLQTPGVHSDNTSRPCNACGEGFLSEQLLTKHRKQCTSLKKAQTFTCDVCNKDHDSLIKLRRHSAIKCTTIYTKPKYSKQLIQKINKDRKRQNKKPISNSRDKKSMFMCESCGCIKKTKEQIGIHIRIHHTKEQSFLCDYCGKGFFFKHSLQSHILYHMGITDTLTCNYCSKNFSNVANRRRHEITVHEGLRFKCEICATTFTTKRSMQDHVRHTHEGVPWPKRVRNRRQ